MLVRSSSVSNVTSLLGGSLCVKSKSTARQSVSQSETRSPINLFWTAKKERKNANRQNVVPPEQMWAQVGSLAASKGSSRKCRQRAQHLLRQLRPRPGLADFPSSLQEFYQLQLWHNCRQRAKHLLWQAQTLASVARGKFNYEIQQFLGFFYVPFLV